MSNFPIISQKLENMLWDINNGIEYEKNLRTQTRI